MMTFIVICILFVIIAVGTFQKELDKNKNDLKKFNNNNFKAAISSNKKNNQIIDGNGKSKIINSNVFLSKYINGVPKWTNKNIISFSEITNATSEQVNFYNTFKKSFVNGEIISLEGNNNYAFILMYELISEYKKDKNFLKLETRLNKLGNCWSDTKPYVISILKQKREEDNIKEDFNHNDDSIIDVTNNKSHLINEKSFLSDYIPRIPEWKNQYLYSFSEINLASNEQKEFYRIFKYSFLNGIYYNLYKNTNYAFILMNDFKNEYDEDKNLLKLETKLNKLGENYPYIKPYGLLILKQKRDEVNISGLKHEDLYSHSNPYEEYWKLGSKYKKKLKLNEDEIKLLNYIYSPNNVFFNIEYCCFEIIRLYITIISGLREKYIQEGTTIDEQFLTVIDIIARKHFKYRKGSPNYKYCIQTTTNEIYSNIFKHCENTVREYYGHKRKINTETYYITTEAKTEFETKIISKVLDLLPVLITKVNPPDDATEIELNVLNTSRWKIKFEELIAKYNEKPKEFTDAIIVLGKLNKKNPSVENIFFEASKFIAKYDKESSLYLYFHYLYEDLKSTTFDNKQLTKTIQKSLFKTNEQLQDFERIATELIKDKDLNKALKQIPEIYKIKRKKIQFDTAFIKEVIEQHSETVELLNEYLKDDIEDENQIIKPKEENKEITKVEKNQVDIETSHSTFIKDLPFSPIHIATLEFFSNSNFSVPQSELELFAKSKGIFKNQIIENINEICYDYLDDVLIEEEEDYYTINTNYFQRISVQ